MADSPTDPHAVARANMVDSQVRPNKVNDPRLLAAMRALPRERFLPANLAALAYADGDVPLGAGRVLMEPMVIARLLQAAEPRKGERVLVVAAGVGYAAALLAALECRVTALEQEPSLIAVARDALKQFAPGVSLVTGALSAGWAEGGPYDVILIEGAIPAIPPAIAGQLNVNGGRLVTVLTGPGRTSRAVLTQAVPAGTHTQPIFDCATLPLPSFRPAPAFAF